MERGHTYYIASGQYSGVKFKVPGDLMITIKKATASDHGTSQGWHDTYASGPAAFPYWENVSGHWVLDGMERASKTSGHGFQINMPLLNQACAGKWCNAIFIDRNQNVDNVTVRHTEIIGFGTNVKGYLSGVYAGHGPAMVSNITFSSSYIHDFGYGGRAFHVSDEGIEA